MSYNRKTNATERVTHRYLRANLYALHVANKTADEDDEDWAWESSGAMDRQIDSKYVYDLKNLEPLARTLRSVLMALGHLQTARTTFTKIKSQRVSPDGNLGGKGYVMSVKDIRKRLSNCDEALSSIVDTLDDEIKAAHWQPNPDGPVKQVMDDVDDIKDDPEQWAEDEVDDLDKGGS